ncbi:MAG TPA: FAD-dependent oxidoreductase [Solirubrobacteraceae bacterium]|nr:FAD-dependent oxidoreductase [Solirubrobacteraceae bacterium]
MTVIGAGVIGLTCAYALRTAGYRVALVADDRPRVSDVAGGLWLPYAAGHSEQVMGWALETLSWLESRGFPARAYLHLQAAEPWWLNALPAGRVRPARAAELPAGYDHGWLLQVPLVEMARHLRELEPARITRRTVTSLDEFSGLVVNCTGLGARRLAADPTVSAARGQVVHVAGLPRVPCLCDEDRMIYILPREDRTIVGGSYEQGNQDEAVDPAQSESLLARARALVPQLAAAAVLGAQVGLRPARADGPRVERVGDVIHCYGHGGAGLTLSWGCARRVVELAAG